MSNAQYKRLFLLAQQHRSRRALPYSPADNGSLPASINTDTAIALAPKTRTDWARRPRPTIIPRYTDQDRDSNRHSPPLR